MGALQRAWPDGAARVPYWVYSDPEVYAAELERIWYGPHWLYCALEAEIPGVGDWKTTTLGERPVVVVRGGAHSAQPARGADAPRQAERHRALRRLP